MLLGFLLRMLSRLRCRLQGQYCCTLARETLVDIEKQERPEGKEQDLDGESVPLDFLYAAFGSGLREVEPAVMELCPFRSL